MHVDCRCICFFVIFALCIAVFSFLGSIGCLLFLYRVGSGLLVLSLFVMLRVGLLRRFCLLLVCLWFCSLAIDQFVDFLALFHGNSSLSRVSLLQVVEILLRMSHSDGAECCDEYDDELLHDDFNVLDKNGNISYGLSAAPYLMRGSSSPC